VIESNIIHTKHMKEDTNETRVGSMGVQRPQAIKKPKAGESITNFFDKPRLNEHQLAQVEPFRIAHTVA